MNTIYDKSHRREIPNYKKGKRLYFQPSELLPWIANGRVKTQHKIDTKAISHVMSHPLDSKQKKNGAKGKEVVIQRHDCICLSQESLSLTKDK